MADRYDTKTLIIAAVALIGVLAISYWAYGTYKQREAGKAAVAFVTDTGNRLRDAIGIQTAPPTMDRTQFVRKLDEHAAIADANLQNFRQLERVPQPLADAADDYLVTTNELLKRIAESQRHRLLLSESSRALLDHMNRDDRTAGWIQEAVKAKDRVNKDYRGYTFAVETTDKLLRSLAASQKNVAPYADKATLIEDSLISRARERGQDDLKLVAAEFEKINRIAGPK